MTADGSVTNPRRPQRTGNGAAEATLATRLAEKICAFRPEDMTARALSEARTAIIDTIGCTLAGIPEPCAQILLADARRRRCARPRARVRHQPSHQRARCDADQRHRLARARLRRRLGRAGRAPLGTRHGAHLRARRAAEGLGPAGAGRLHHRRRDRGAAVARGQLPPLRQGLAPHRHARHLRRGGRGRPPARARRRAHGQGAGARRLVRVRPQGQLRHHDEAAARRPRRPQRPVRGADRRARLRVQPRRARAQAGLARGLQRQGHLLARAHVRELGLALGDRDRPRWASSSSPAAARRIRPSP